MVTLNTCPLQIEMMFSRHKNKAFGKFYVIKHKGVELHNGNNLCEAAMWVLPCQTSAHLLYDGDMHLILPWYVMVCHITGLLLSVLENIVLSDCKEGPGITGWLQNVLLFLLFSGWNLHLPGSKKTESESSYQQLTTSSTTLLKCSNTPMQPMATTGASGACTSSHHRTGLIKGTSQHPSGKSPTCCHFVLTTSPS